MRFDVASIIYRPIASNINCYTSIADASDGDRLSELLQNYRRWASKNEPYIEEGFKASHVSKFQRAIVARDATMSPCMTK